MCVITRKLAIYLFIIFIVVVTITIILCVGKIFENSCAAASAAVIWVARGARAHFKTGARWWGSGGGRARKLSRVGKRQGHLGPITD